MKDALLVFVGGGTGAVLRWLLFVVTPTPWGIVGVNLLGSGLLAMVAHPANGLPAAWRLLLGTGVLGGFTTYSTFNLDMLTAVQASHPGRAAAIGALTLGGGLLAGALGWWTAGRIWG
jgi:CrcB protein